MNKVILIGRWTNDPTITTTNTTTIAKGTLAVDRKYKKDGEQDADFFRVTAFGKTAEFIEKYFVKGMKAVVIGRLQQNDYEKDGVKHYSTEVIIEEIEFAESKKNNPQNEIVQEGKIEDGDFVTSDGEAESVFNF